MYTLLDGCLDRIDIFEFLSHVEDGLKDHYDVKMLTYLMLVRLANLAPGPVIQRKYDGGHLTLVSLAHLAHGPIIKCRYDRGHLI